MADFISDVAEYLADQGVVVVTGAGTNCFVGHYPDDPDNIVAVLGLEGGQLPNANVREFEYPRFQVIIRNTDYETGGTKLRDIRNALHARIGITFDNYHVLRLHCQQEGGPIGRDEAGRYEFSINFYGQARET